MQLRGQNRVTSLTQTVTLPRPGGNDWTFTLQPLPLGFHRRLRSRGVSPPAPPVRLVRDSSGRPLRDEAGQAVTTIDTTDRQYLAELELYHQRVAVLAVAEALRADPQVSFDVPPPTGDSSDAWTQYADALHTELEAAGFTAGDLILLCQAVCRMSNLLTDHLRTACGNFSSAAPAAPT